MSRHQRKKDAPCMGRGGGENEGRIGEGGSGGSNTKEQNKDVVVGETTRSGRLE